MSKLIITIDKDKYGHAIDFSGESTATSRIRIYGNKAIVFWNNNGAVWEYEGIDIVSVLQTLTSTDSLGKTAWAIKRSAKKETNITSSYGVTTNTKENNNA
jgi:hypothetical protein